MSRGDASSRLVCTATPVARSDGTHRIDRVTSPTGFPRLGTPLGPDDSSIASRPATARFSLLTRLILAVVLFFGMWLSVIPPEGARALQLILGGVAAIAAVASVWVPLSGTLLAGIATAAAWMLGLTADPFLLTGIGIMTIAERQGRQRFPVWILVCGAALAVAVLTVQLGTNDPRRDPMWRSVLSSAIVVSGAWAIGVRTRQVRESAAERARTVERLRVARDVHDALSHSLSTIGVQAGVAAHVDALTESELRDKLRSIETQSRDSMRELHALIHQERSTPGSFAEAPPALTTLLRGSSDAARASGLRVVFEADDAALDRLPAHVSATVHRIVQEAVTNAIRHASASTLTISATPGTESVEILVADDGRGTGADSAGTASGPHVGHGLTGMRERVELLGGTLHVDGSNGFAVRASIPSNDSGRSHR